MYENGVQAMTREEKFALDKIRLSLVHDGEPYQVAKEKRFIRQPLVGEDY